MSEQNHETETNIYGVVGFVFSLVGLLTCGGGALIGLTLSIMGCFPKIAGNRKMGLAIAGCILSGLQVLGRVVFFIFWLANLFPSVVVSHAALPLT